MRGLLADVHAEGYLATLVRICQGPQWGEFWRHINVKTLHLADVGLHVTVIDSELWEFCQRNELLLLTSNRNSHDPDSLEAVIRQRNTPDCLPVITLANTESFRLDRTYREQTAMGLLQILLDVDHFRGTGRIFIPNETPP